MTKALLVAVVVDFLVGMTVVIQASEYFWSGNKRRGEERKQSGLNLCQKQGQSYKRPLLHRLADQRLVD